MPMFKKKGKKKGFVPFKKKGSSDDDKDSTPFDKSKKGEKHRPRAGVQAAALRSMKD